VLNIITAKLKEIEAMAILIINPEYPEVEDFDIRRAIYKGTFKTEVNILFSSYRSEQV